MSEYDELLKLAKMADERGDKETALKAMKALDALGSDRTLTDELTVNSTRPFELFGRNALEGLADVADIATGPIKAGLNLLPGFNYGTDTYSGAVSGGLDELNVAKPETKGEKIVGTATKTLAGLSPFMGAGGLLSKSSVPITKAIGETLTTSPLLQMTSAASSGGAGETAKQSGAGPWGQFLASLTAGLAPVAAKSVYNSAKLLMPESKGVQHAIEGLDLEGLPKASVDRIRSKIDEALKTGDLDHLALKRMIDFELTGATPTKASLTLDPIDKTQQLNLSKIGAQSTNPNMQTLSRVESANNQTLLGGLDDLANNVDLDPYAAGKAAFAPITNKRQGLIDVQKNLYSQARDSTGRAAPLDRAGFINQVDDLLVEGNLTAFLPKEIKKTLNTIALGKIKIGGESRDVPFNVNTIDQLKSMLAAEQRTAKGSAKQALSVVREALDNTQLQGGVSDEAIIAFDKARAATLALKKWEESSPAIKAIVDGATPETFMDRYILSKTAGADDVAKLVNEVKSDKPAFDALKYQVAAWIRDKAAPQNIDGAGKLNASSLNNALKKIGDRKLELFFSPKELKTIKATNRVAFYDQYQPIGSAVNNSNTATTLTGGLLNFVADRSPTARALGSLLRVGDAAINNSGRARQALSPSLLYQTQQNNKGLLAAPLSLGLIHGN